MCPAGPKRLRVRFAASEPGCARRAGPAWGRPRCHWWLQGQGLPSAAWGHAVPLHTGTVTQTIAARGWRQAFTWEHQRSPCIPPRPSRVALLLDVAGTREICIFLTQRGAHRSPAPALPRAPVGSAVRTHFHGAFAASCVNPLVHVRWGGGCGRVCVFRDILYLWE